MAPTHTGVPSADSEEPLDPDVTVSGTESRRAPPKAGESAAGGHIQEGSPTDTLAWSPPDQRRGCDETQFPLGVTSGHTSACPATCRPGVKPRTREKPKKRGSPGGRPPPCPPLHVTPPRSARLPPGGPAVEQPQGSPCPRAAEGTPPPGSPAHPHVGEVLSPQPACS